MNKSETNNRKDVEYHVSQEDNDIVKFGQLWTLNRWGGITGSTTPGCEYDAWMKKKNKTYVIELKGRDVPSYAYTTCYIEIDKYCELLMFNKAYGYTPLYIAFYEDGKALVWSILENLFPHKTRKKNARNKGFEGNVRENNVCYELPINKAYVYKYE